MSVPIVPEQIERFPAKPASFGERLLAKLVDYAVVNVFSTVVFALWIYLQAVGISGVSMIAGLVSVMGVFWVLYQSLLTMARRQTLGYYLTGLHVVSEKDEAMSIGFRRSFVRSLLDLVFYILTGYLIGLADYIPIAVTKSKRALHDHITGTRVVSDSRAQYGLVAASLAGSVVFVFVMTFCVFRPLLMESLYMPTPSMAPTIPVNGSVVLNKIAYITHPPRRGDIVAFDIPESASSYFPPDIGHNYIKRIVGLPGDEITMTGGHVYLYSEGRTQILPEPNIVDRYTGDVPTAHGDNGPDDWFTRRRSSLSHKAGRWWITVPPSEYFVLGDNRNDSNDSHVWGFLPRTSINGRITMMFMPQILDL